nr:immunoglobulin light chain junction region [Macaca mulatta]
CSAYADINVLF